MGGRPIDVTLLLLYAVARDETANENARLIFIYGDRIPPHDRFTDRIARVVHHGSRRHLNPFTCRIDRIRNEVAGRAEFPVGAMPIGDITAMNAAGTADRLKPRSHVIGNVVPLPVVEGRRRRDQRSNCKNQSRHRSRSDHGVISACENDPGTQNQPNGGMRSSTLASRKVSPSNASILVSVPSPVTTSLRLGQKPTTRWLLDAERG